MGKRNYTEHPEAQAVANKAWDIKGIAEDYFTRPMTAERASKLRAAQRDLARIEASLSDALETKRGKKEEGVADTSNVVQLPLGNASAAGGSDAGE